MEVKEHFVKRIYRRVSPFARLEALMLFQIERTLDIMSFVEDVKNDIAQIKPGLDAVAQEIADLAAKIPTGEVVSVEDAAAIKADMDAIAAKVAALATVESAPTA